MPEPKSAPAAAAAVVTIRRRADGVLELPYRKRRMPGRLAWHVALGVVALVGIGLFVAGVLPGMLLGVGLVLVALGEATLAYERALLLREPLAEVRVMQRTRRAPVQDHRSA